MDKVFIYWDNSTIFHGAQYFAEQRNDGPDARWRVRIDIENMLKLAHANRPMVKAVAAGSIPPEMSQLWNRLENMDVEVKIFDRGASDRGEQDVPDRILQLRMLEDGLDYNGDPGIVVLLTGDGAGYVEGAGFHSTLTRLHMKGWRIEVLSWAHSCNRNMRKWVEEHGIFVPLDDFYDSVTFTIPSREGHEFALSRKSVPLNFDNRAKS